MRSELAAPWNFRESLNPAVSGECVDVITKHGSGANSLVPQLGEIEMELGQVSTRSDAVRAELAALERQVIDPNDLAQAIRSFSPIWTELFPAERARVLQLLIEEIRYDAAAEEVTITFWPNGVRSLAREDEKETA